MFAAEWDDPADGSLVCVARGELDLRSAAELRQTFVDVAPDSTVLLDLSELTFADSSGLSAIVGGVHSVRERGGRIALVCGPSAPLARLLQRARLERVVPIAASRQEARGILDDDRHHRWRGPIPPRPRPRVS